MLSMEFSRMIEDFWLVVTLPFVTMLLTIDSLSKMLEGASSGPLDKAVIIFYANRQPKSLLVCVTSYNLQFLSPLIVKV